jgi:hypothetical protein
VLYGATDRKAAFLETLQTYRPSLSDLARVQNAPVTADIELSTEGLGVIPTAYFALRRIAVFRLAGSSRCLDLRSVATHAALRVILAGDLLGAGYDGQFNFGEIIGVDYAVTQPIARWAFGEGYDGIIYASTHDHALSCWAIFDRAEIAPIGAPEEIRRDDPDLMAAAELFGLIIPK